MDSVLIMAAMVIVFIIAICIFIMVKELIFLYQLAKFYRSIGGKNMEKKAKITGNPVSFKSPDDMLNLIKSGKDFYNINTGDYVFNYNECGSIAAYTLSLEKAAEIQEKAKADKQYWGAYLGPGGRIYDDLSRVEDCNLTTDNLEWCKEKFALPGWVEVTE